MVNFNLMKAGALLLGIVIVSVLVLDSALKSQAVEFLSEDYTDIVVGKLPDSHSMLAGAGRAEIQNGIQKDGSMGRILIMDGGTSVILSSLADLGDVGVYADINDTYQSGFMGIRMSSDGQNGYLAFYDAYSRSVVLYKVKSGTREELTRTQIRSGVNGWNRLSLEARGNKLRVAVDKNDEISSSEIIAYDNSFTSGKIILGKDSGRGFDIVRFDNLLVKSADPLLNSGAAVLPFGLGFENNELFYRNNILQHPNVELLTGGYNIAADIQKNGNTGNLLLISSGTTVKINTAPLTDISLSGDLHDVYQSANLGLRMSPDGKNGYLAVFDAYAESAVIYKVKNGSRSELGRALIKFGPTGWNRISFEARGQELRATVDKNGGILMSEIIVRDDSFSVGGILISKDAGHGLDFAKLDNMAIKLPDTLITGSQAPMPNSIYFNDNELSYRNNILKHPNIDLVSGGYNFSNLLQRDGTSGNVLLVGGGSSVEIQSQQLADVEIAYDINDMNQTGYAGIRMSSDGKNGYLGVSDVYNRKLQIFKLENGARVLFGELVLGTGSAGWNRITLSAIGNEIKAVVAGGGGSLDGEVAVNDSSFSAGGIVFGKDAGRGLDAVRFDNITISGTSLASDLDGDGVSDLVDICRSVFGKSAYNGCPSAAKISALLHIIDQQKSGICGQLPNGKPRLECKPAATGAVVKVFSPTDPAFVSAYGSARPASKYFKLVYDSDLAKIGQCATDGAGKCLVGVDSFKNVLVILRYAEAGGEVYDGEFETISNIGGTDSTESNFQFMKIIRADGSVSIKN